MVQGTISKLAYDPKFGRIGNCREGGVEVQNDREVQRERVQKRFTRTVPGVRSFSYENRLGS